MFSDEIQDMGCTDPIFPEKVLLCGSSVSPILEKNLHMGRQSISATCPYIRPVSQLGDL